MAMLLVWIGAASLALHTGARNAATNLEAAPRNDLAPVPGHGVCDFRNNSQ